MTEDALYILDLFHLQIGTIKWELMDKAIRPAKFDAYSFGAWAIQESIDAIKSCDGLVDRDTILGILEVQRDMYGSYYDNNNKQKRFKHALDMINYLIKITGGCM